MKLSEFVSEKLKYKSTKHGKNDRAEFIVGYEIEHTAAYGKKTLLVTDINDLSKIEELLTEIDSDHLYLELTLALSKTKNAPTMLTKYKKVAKHFLDKDIWCTIDIPPEYVEEVVDLCSYKNFVVNIAVVIPCIKSLNKNAALKISDEYSGDNGGVWVTDIKSITVKSNFTPWNKYNKDRGVDLE